MLQKGSVIKLDNNNEYVVVSTVSYEKNNYVYVININDNKDFMFCKHDGDDLSKVIDSALVEKLLILFAEQVV